MSDFYVGEFTLSDSADQWGDGAGQIRSAADNVGGAPTSGFRPDVSANAATFVINWRTHLNTMATNADDISDNLRQAEIAYRDSDSASRSVFERWLAQAPE